MPISEKAKKHTDVAALSIEEISEVMYNKNLTFSDEVVDVIYCPDKTKRYVVLKRSCGENYTFIYEELVLFDADELQWIKTDAMNQNGVLPAYWSQTNSTLSIFGTSEEAINSIRFEPQYKQYFKSEQ